MAYQRDLGSGVFGKKLEGEGCWFDKGELASNFASFQRSSIGASSLVVLWTLMTLCTAGIWGFIRDSIDHWRIGLMQNIWCASTINMVTIGLGTMVVGISKWNRLEGGSWLVYDAQVGHPIYNLSAHIRRIVAWEWSCDLHHIVCEGSMCTDQLPKDVMLYLWSFLC